MTDTGSQLPPVVDRLRPYAALARLHAPIGFLLLMWPCWWAVALAAPPFLHGAKLLIFFFIGAAVMRAAGCVYNDIADRDFDRRVARTRTRPIASGAIAVPHAVLFMIGLSLVGLVILLQLNRAAVILGVASLALVAVYPFMKRVTWWPQAWLGLTFNWGALVGWAAVTGGLAVPALILYGAGIAWTLGYDTIYAHQDKVDDALIGVKSSARRLGIHSRPYVYAFYALTVFGLAAAAIAAGKNWLTYPLLLVAAGHGLWMVKTVDFDDPDSCLARFKANNLFALLVFGAYLAG